jgi:catechol 2,3-dioxygenase-like lactoylglutathione lyase family enzyme
MKPLPASYRPQDFYSEAEDLLQDFNKGSREAFELVRRHAAQPGKRGDLGMPVDNFDLTTAQEVLARKYGFDNREKFIAFIEDLNIENSDTRQFENAVDAIVNGDKETLSRLLKVNPGLVQMRSERQHRATLLHYSGANGVEGYRQKTPPNAVEIATLLLIAGADSNATGALYTGGATTLGLVATSVWPAKAGVQEDLMDVLVKFGANIDGDPEGWNPLIAALDNARPEAAKWLDGHGATLTVGSAAGVGRLDMVKKLFDNTTQTYGKRWRVPATPEAQRIRALIYAGMYGHTEIVAFLVEKGVDIGAQDDDQYTALHYAAHGGHTETVDWLLQHNAPLEKKNCYGGTVLGQAIWSAVNNSGGWGGNKAGFDYFPIIKKLIDAGAVINPWWTTNIENIDNLLRSHTKKPLPQCRTIMPELPMNNVEAGVAWYRDVMGFSVNYAQHDIGVMDRDKARVLLIARTDKHTGIGSCYIYVEDADALYTEFRAKGVQIENSPVSQPWGLREFVVFDPEGNRITFGQPFE